MYRIIKACDILAAFTKVEKESNVGDLYLWVIILLGVLLFFGMVWMVVRGRINNAQTTEAESLFSLGALRKMHREGQLSDEEFEKAKALVIGAHMKKDTSSQESTKSQLDDSLESDEGSDLGPNLLDADDSSTEQPTNSQDPKDDAPEPDPYSDPPANPDAGPLSDDGQTGNKD